MKCCSKHVTHNQRVPGSSPGAPTISTYNTAPYDDRSRCRLAIGPLGHTGVTDRQETHEMGLWLPGIPSPSPDARGSGRLQLGLCRTGCADGSRECTRGESCGSSTCSRRARPHRTCSLAITSAPRTKSIRLCLCSTSAASFRCVGDWSLAGGVLSLIHISEPTRPY